MSESDDTKPGAVPVTEGTPRANSETAAEKPAKPTGSRRIAWTFLLVIIVVVFAVGFLSAIMLAPRLAGILPLSTTAEATAASADAEKLAALEANLAALERKLGDLTSSSEARAREQAEQLKAVQAGASQAQAGASQVQAVASQIKAAQAEQSTLLGSVREQIADTAERLAKLERSAAESDAAIGRMAAIERRLEGLAQSGNAEAVAADLLARLERLEAQPATPAAAESADDERLQSVKQELRQELGKRLDELASQIEALPAARADDGQASVRVARVETLLGELAGRIDALNVGERSELERGVGLVLAAAALRDASRRFAGYGSELAVVNDLAPKVVALTAPPVVAALNELARHAGTGAPTVAVLAAQFGEVAGRVVRAAERDADAGWIAQTLDRVSQVVSVRRVGDVDGATVEARVARAELRLSAGDLAAAVGELADLSGPAAGAAAPWLANANKRLAVDRAAQVLYEAAARSLLAGVPSE